MDLAYNKHKYDQDTIKETKRKGPLNQKQPQIGQRNAKSQ